MTHAVRILFALLWLGVALPAWAVLPGEMLPDPMLEARARAISQQLRCLVCQNQSIDESNVDLAHDLRILVRRRLLAGDTDAQAIGYIVARYGQFVLLTPPIEPATYALWFGPAAILLLAAAGIAYRRRRWAVGTIPDATPLSAAEQAGLTQLLAEREP
jgi:cytochrome c-type biogenesis protein CcmH